MQIFFSTSSINREILIRWLLVLEYFLSPIQEFLQIKRTNKHTKLFNEFAMKCTHTYLPTCNYLMEEMSKRKSPENFHTFHALTKKPELASQCYGILCFFPPLCSVNSISKCSYFLICITKRSFHIEYSTMFCVV